MEQCEKAPCLVKGCHSVPPMGKKRRTNAILITEHGITRIELPREAMQPA